MRFILMAALMLAVSPLAALAQTVPSAPQQAETFDTSYQISTVASARIQRQFLDSIRWSVGTEARDDIRAAFSERPPLEVWQELVAADGLELGNVADALTAYWVLNWVTANARYNLKVDNAPIRRQMAAAMAADANFQSFNDLQKQDMAEGYILKFLVEHAALNDAMVRKDVGALGQLALAAATRFRQQMGVDLLSLVPGAEGLVPGRAAE